MQMITSSELSTFQKRLYWKNSKLKRIKFLYDRVQLAIGFWVITREKPDLKKVLLQLEVGSVHEFRFQQRPIPIRTQLDNVSMAFLQSKFYIDWNPFELDEKPELMDFRASEFYIGGYELKYSIKPLTKN